MTDLRNLARPGDFFCKIDFEHAYLHVPMAATSIPWLGMTNGGRFFRWRALPFGLNLSPRVFTKILRPVMGYLRARGIRCLIYLDDVI